MASLLPAQAQRTSGSADIAITRIPPISYLQTRSCLRSKLTNALPWRTSATNPWGMLMSNAIRGAAVAVLLIACAELAASAGEPAAAVKIGVLTDMSGPYG